MLAGMRSRSLAMPSESSRTKRNAEAVPQLGLELGEHRLAGQHQDAVGATAAEQFDQDHAHLDGLAQADRIGQQQPGAELPQRPLDGHLLEVHGLERPHAHQIGLDAGGRHLAKLGFEEELREAVAAGIVSHQLGIAGIDRLDGVQLGQENALVAADQVVGADAMDGASAD